MNTLDANQPLNPTNEPTRFRREAQTHYMRGMGALALAGLGAYGIARYQPFLRAMPEKIAGTLMREPTMLGYGFWEAGKARSPAAYAKMMGLGTHATGTPRWRWIDMMMEVTKRAEEVSPSQMLRTFGVYEHLMPLATRRGVTMRFTGQQAVDQLQYLRALTGKTIDETQAAKRGLTLAKGKLWLGKPGELPPLLEHAHLMMRKYVPTGATGMIEEAAHFGRLAATYEQTIGGGERLLRPVRTGLFEGQTAGRILRTEQDVSSFMIAGGQTPWQAIKRYGSASTRMWSQRFFRLMDDPFLGMLEIMGHYDRDAVNVTRMSKLWEKAGLKNLFGLGGRYTGTTAEMFGKWLLPGAPGIGRKLPRPGILAAAIGLPLAYHVTSEMLAEHGQGTVAQAGIPGVAAELSERVMMARARVGRATGLQGYAAWQEEAAPESTRLTTALGLPLAGGLMGAFAGYFRRLIPSVMGDPIRALRSARRTARLPGFLGRMIRKPMGRTGRWAAIGLGIGLALEAPFLPGVAARLLGGAKTPEELEEIYSGRQEVPVRRSRWWIFGRRRLEGDRPEYFIPHWTVRARSRARQKALFAGDEEAGPLFRALKQTPLAQDIIDPYYFEKLHYRDRPYPITGPSDLGLGPLDPIYKATIGKVLKPVRYMHEEEWAPEGEPVAWEPRPPLAPVPELGGESPYAPREPYKATELARQTAEYYSEAIGIIGWMGRLATRSFFGDVTPYDVQPRMQTAGEIASVKRAYWDLSLGDPFGTTEAYRRLNPRKNRGQYWNPLRNQMPSWLPGEEYFIDFQTGDPYAKIPRGEYRLPGAGYEALHPELEGIDPENYDEYHRFRILADVAPYSKQYKYFSKRMTAADLGEERRADVQRVRAQVSEAKQRKKFFEYKTEEEMADLDIVQRGMANWWETAAHLAETPVEQAIFPPLAPMGKFVHQRTAIEDYERSQVYGTDLSFWNRLWENFLRPGIYSFANVMGYEGVPPPIREKRDIEDYFDKMAYVKALRLERDAELVGDRRQAAEQRKKRKQTMTGVNPYGSPLYIMRGMPKRERDYWKAFTQETDPEKQKRILELVPEDVGESYRAFWLRDAAAKLRKAVKKGEVTGDDLEQAEDLFRFVEEDMDRQGQPFTSKLAVDFADAVKKGEAKPSEYADWYRMQETQEFFQSHQLPGPKWIGWDPRVDLEDVKMKYVRQEGYDFHDFDLWEDRLYAMTRKPYLNEITTELSGDHYEARPAEVQRNLREMIGSYGPGQRLIPEMNGGRLRFDIRDNQTDSFNHAISRARF